MLYSVFHTNFVCEIGCSIMLLEVDKRDDEYRKELIELKKKRAEMVDPGSERIAKPEPPPPPMTLSGKIKHYWFYYKYYLLAVIAVALVVGISIRSCVNRVNPDVSVLCLTKNTILDDDLTKLETALARYAKDYNNNGRVDVTVISITHNENDSQMNYAMQQKLMAEIAAGESYLYISDDAGFERFTQIEALKDISSLSDSTTDNGTAVSISISELLKDEKTVTLPEKLYFSMRVYNENDLNKNNKKGQSIKNSLETFKAILSNQPVIQK